MLITIGKPDGKPRDHGHRSQILRTSTSHEEGGKRDWGISTTGFSGSNGKLEKLHAVRVRFVPAAAGGRPRMEQVPGSEFTLDVDLVLLAMGFLGPVREGAITQLGVELDARGNVATRGYASSVPGVFAAGDLRRGQSLVVWAIAEGRQAAAEADAWLRSR